MTPLSLVSLSPQSISPHRLRYVFGVLVLLRRQVCSYGGLVTLTAWGEQCSCRTISSRADAMDYGCIWVRLTSLSA